jgi:fatty acid desaturase
LSVARVLPNIALMVEPRTSDSERRAPRAMAQWRTWLLIPTVYGTWLLAVIAYRLLGHLAGTAFLILATCWFTSLQHELIHGHPSRSRRLNGLFGLAPLAVWYPYELYRRSHLAHHRDELLTEPGIDPESNYIEGAAYRRLPACIRPMWVAQRTVLGRLFLGPSMVIVPTWFDIVRRPLRRDFTQLRSWAVHLALLGALLLSLDRYAGIGPFRYLLTICYPALGLAMLRSFYEHRPAESAPHRVVINEAGLFWRILYLNNNYHAVHHERPDLPWYRVRRFYLDHRADVLGRNGGFVVPGYLSLMSRYAMTIVDSPIHPMPVDR